ncbi:MAG: transposase [Cyclobacteriaceae bacterium]|nr:transposase [Cyclobacteriaceae bacterium]
MTTEERRRRRFSEEFRKEQVKLIEAGKVTIQEVSKLYQVKTANVREWLKKFGKIKLPEQIIVSNGKEFDRIRELEKENKRLLEHIGKQQVELVYKNELLELAKERLGEDFEKK